MKSAFLFFIVMINTSFKCSDQTRSACVAETVLYGNTVSSRFECPEGFHRTVTDSHSFACFLRNLKLKAPGTQVKYYDGTFKTVSGVHCAVIDMSIGKKDLQQCADAVMRLRAEYLFAEKRYSEIGFRFLGDGKIHTYLEYAGRDRTYPRFLKYMDHVFSFANTASLHAQMKHASFYDMQIGDVFIQKGNPYGHAVIVMDMCSDSSGNRKYMLAQSYMPAQDTHILLNEEKQGPWYSIASEFSIRSPQWTFDTTNLHRW